MGDHNENKNEGFQLLNWKDEAQAVINDVKYHLSKIEIAENTLSKSSIYLNLTTLEGTKLCVLMNSEGFRVTGNIHDCCDIKDEVEIYETIYSLLQTHSPKYVNSFAATLAAALNNLKEQ
ncbi:unnamed protein product [Diamesa serratosioi]